MQIKQSLRLLLYLEMEVLGCIRVYSFTGVGANRPKNTSHCYLIKLGQGERGAKGGRVCIRHKLPHHLERSAAGSCIPTRHLLIFICLRKLNVWRDEKKIVQVEGKQMSGDKTIMADSDLPHGKAGKRAHQYLLGFREVLQDLLPAAITVSDRPCPHWEDEVWNTSVQNEEQGSSVGVLLVHPNHCTFCCKSQIAPTGRFFTISRWAFTAAIS